MFEILGLELSQEEGEEERKEGGRKWEIEMGHLGYWSLSCHRRRGMRKGRREEGRGRLRWDIWDPWGSSCHRRGRRKGEGRSLH